MPILTIASLKALFVAGAKPTELNFIDLIDTLNAGMTGRTGSATLTAGTSGVIANTSVTANTKVFLTRSALGGGAVGDLSYVTAAGVGLTINSSSATDASTVEWLLIEAV